MLATINSILGAIDDFVWGIPLIVLILAVGIFLTIRLKGLQITKLPNAIRHIRNNEKSGTDGEVSSFGALCTALSATIGTGNIVGVEADPGRRNQQQIINQLKSKKFVSGIRPRIELRTLTIQDHEVDVIIVKNTADTPYYLVEDYKDQGRIVRAYHIYTRVCDTNTDIDKSADIDHTEYLWKKRFGLTTVPLERFIKKLKNKEEWIKEEDFYYNKYNKTYQLVFYIIIRNSENLIQ